MRKKTKRDYISFIGKIRMVNLQYPGNGAAGPNCTFAIASKKTGTRTQFYLDSASDRNRFDGMAQLVLAAFQNNLSVVIYVSSSAKNSRDLSLLAERVLVYGTAYETGNEIPPGLPTGITIGGSGGDSAECLFSVSDSTGAWPSWYISSPYNRNVPALIGVLVSEGNVVMHNPDPKTIKADAATIHVSMPILKTKKIARARKSRPVSSGAVK